MKTVTIYTDGACSGNPGPGGWGAILRYKDTEKELSGGAADTTNNRMELTAVIEALDILKARIATRSPHKLIRILLVLRCEFFLGHPMLSFSHSVSQLMNLPRKIAEGTELCSACDLPIAKRSKRRWGSFG